MLIETKLQYSTAELKKMRAETEGYVWLAVDVKRHIMVAGNEHFRRLKEVLFRERCRSSDIWGAGINLESGEVDYCSPVNRKLIPNHPTTDMPEEMEERVGREVRYFFGDLAKI